MAPFALLLGIGPLVRWGRDRPRKLKTLLLVAFVTTLVLSLLLPWLFEDRIAAMTVVGGDGVLDFCTGDVRSVPAYFSWDEADAKLLGHGVGSRRVGDHHCRYCL